MSMLVMVEGVVHDLETSTGGPDGVSPLVGEPVPDDEGWPPADGPG